MIEILTNDTTNVVVENIRRVSLVDIPEKRETTQKYESLACDMVKVPAPIAHKTIILPISLSS